MQAALSMIRPPRPDAWDSARFSNDVGEEMPESTDEVIFPQQSSFYTATPDYTGGDYDYAFDPRLRGITTTSSGVSPVAVPVLDTVVNPIENLSNRVPLPTVSSPVDTTKVGGRGGATGGSQPEDAMCCGAYIPHFELRQTREQLGMNQAGRARYGRSPGEGVALEDDHERVASQTKYSGPVNVSEPLYTHELYDQGFISMSAVPSVFVGVYTDPVTGEEYDAYESAMPPPDADYEESLNSSGRNVKLAHLQGGWRDTTPRPTKTEVLEDDFHMQYDRSINTYGTYDPSYYIDNINHNNRFNHEDRHPDSDGPIITGMPANTLGNQGDTKIRPVPYLPPTNRGKWAETTFRSGVDPAQQAAGGGDQRLEYEWTNTPYVRAESSRADGGGIEAVPDYQGFTQQYGGAEGWDNLETQRSTAQQHTPNMGPMEFGAGQQVFGDVHAPNAITGTQDVGMYGVGNQDSEYVAAMLQDQVVPAPNNMAGLESVDESGFGSTEYMHKAQKLMTGKVESFNNKGGLRANTAISMGSGNTYEGTQLNKSVHGAQHKTKREALLRVQSAFDSALGGYTATQHRARTTKLSDKSGRLTDFMMPGGTVAGESSPYTNGSQNLGAVTNLSTKREATYDNQFGVKTIAPSDNTVYLGEYRQSGEHLNVRPEGNFNHLFGSGGMALGLRDDSEALAR